MSLNHHLQLYLNLSLTIVPFRFQYKQFLVRAGNGYDPAQEDPTQWSPITNLNSCDYHVASSNFIQGDKDG